MRLVWTPAARNDLSSIRRHIERDRPGVARKVVESLRRSARALCSHPAVGRPGRVADTRELVRRPYVIVYRASGAEVEIVRVLHSAQRWPVGAPQDDAPG